LESEFNLDSRNTAREELSQDYKPNLSDLLLKVSTLLKLIILIWLEKICVLLIMKE